MLAKILNPHAKECVAVHMTENGTFGSPWFVSIDNTQLQYGTIVIDGSHWQVWGCRSTYCLARVAVNITEVEDLIEAETQSAFEAKGED